jgi:glycerol-3-phosphate dehydrogenase (NAD(P)+)
MRVSVLGAGGWGTTLAILLSDNGHNVTLWEFNPDYAETMRKFRENFYYLPKVKIPADIRITNNLDEAVQAGEIIVISTPTQFIRSSLQSLRDFDFGSRTILNVSKGIEIDSLLLVNEIVEDIFTKADPKSIAALSGPSHAEEVACKVPTAVVCASKDISIAENIQTVFSNEYFRVYSSTDVAGVETGGALKNVIAIAAGIADGAGFGDNTKAAIMTRGISEIMRLGLTLGADRETFYGLSGIGDLIVTCASKHSRNRFVGEQIGLGRKLDEILSEMKMVAEGVSTSKSALQLAKKNNVEVPIIEKVNEILFNGISPVEATRDLMLRALKAE